MFTFTFTPQTPDQVAILASGFLTSPQSGTLILPTGAGKSQLAWVAMNHCLSQRHKVIYLAPTKGLLEEQYRKWQQLLQPQQIELTDLAPALEQVILFEQPQEVGVDSANNVGRSSCENVDAGEGADGDANRDSLTYRVEIEPVPTVGIFDGDHPTPVGAYQRTDVLLMTPERLDLCLRHPSVQAAGHWIREVRICVVDEVQTLREGHRGARLEGALIRLRQVNPTCRWLALSADLNPEDRVLLNWVGEYVYYSSQRAVPQDWHLITYRNRQEQSRRLVNLMTQHPHLTLVFVSSRNRTSQVKQALNQAGISAEIHHAGCTMADRQAVEERFRSRDGSLQVLVATSTLAVGVNLPARQVVVYDLYKPNGTAIAAGASSFQERFVRITLEEVQQLGGRAGRPGLDPQGTVFLMAQEQDHWAKALLTQPDTLSQKALIPSALATHPTWMMEQLLALVSGEYGNSVEALQSILQSSLAARQRPLPDTGDLIARLLRGQMLSQSSTLTLNATPLGQACTGQYLMPLTGLRWKLALEQVVEAQEIPTFLDWLALLSTAPELKLLGAGRLYYPNHTSPWIQAHLATRLNCQDDPDRLQRLYSHAAVLRTYTCSGGNLPAVLDWAAQQSIHLYLADVQSALEYSIRLVEALMEVAQTLKPTNTAKTPEPLANALGKLQVLKQMLTTGLDGALVSLTLLEGIGPKRAMALNAIGIGSLAQVATADPEQIALIKGISAAKAPKLIEQAQALQGQVRPQWFTDL